MAIMLVDRPISRQQLKAVAQPHFEEVVKAVVDVEKRIMALGGELHADEEGFLLEQDSKQENLWGINFLLEIDPPDIVEFDSMINVRPRQNNRSRSVEDAIIREKIMDIVKHLIR